MRMRISLLILGWASAAMAAASERAVTGSPGSLERIGLVGERCPTFSWGAVQGAHGYELVIYALPEEDDTHEDDTLEDDTLDTVRPLLERSFPGSLRGWTPSLDECLEAGGRYVWFVRALGDRGVGDWSQARLFEVAPSDSSPALELDRALEVVVRYLEAGGTLAELGLAVPNDRGELQPAARRVATQTPAVASALAMPDAVAMRGDVGDPGGVAIGLYGLSASAADGSAGVAGESLAASGATSGVLGAVHSPDGVAGVFDNTAGGQILSGRNTGVEVFSVDGAGVISAAAFVGDGSGLSDVDLSLLDGQSGSFYLDWENLTNFPPGFGVDAAGGVAATSFAGNGSAVTDVDAATLEGQPGSHYLDWGNLTDFPPGFSVDASGSVTATSFVGDGSQVSDVDSATLEGLPGAFYRDWTSLVGVPPGFADGIDHDSGGDITAVFSGAGLAGGGVIGDATLEVDFAQTQARVVGSCLPGQAMVAIFADGSIDCEFIEASTVNTIVDDPQSTVGEYSSIAVGPDGLPVVGYFDRTARALVVTKCNDVYCAGGDETTTTVDDPPANDVGEYTSLAVDANSVPVISYYDKTGGALKVARCNDPACSGGDETITTVDDAGDVGQYTSIALGADGLPVISYWDLTAESLKVAKCNNDACSGGDVVISTVDDPPANSVGAHTSIALGTDGFPVVSYQDVTDDALKVAKCDDDACSGGGEILSTIDDPPSSRVGQWTAIAVGADGFPIISYYDDFLDDLKVAKCNDEACDPAVNGPETITSVDAVNFNDSGWYTSIALGADGLPVISYRESGSGALKVAKCNDDACAGGDESITRVDDPVNRVGSWTSIALGADGLPVISHYDESSGALKVAKCANPSCR